MAAKNRKQEVLLKVQSGSIPFLPVGDYKVYIDGVKVVKGSVQFTGRVLDSQQEWPKKITNELIEKAKGGIEHA